MLCWYQRICLFPLTAILAVGIVRRDEKLASYALPLVLVGLGIAVYHNLLTWGVVPETLDAFPLTNVKICAEVYLHVHPHLACAAPSLEAVERVYAGPHQAADRTSGV